jgi:hypothetical protein
MTLVEEMPKAAGGERARGDGTWELPKGWGLFSKRPRLARNRRDENWRQGQ